jgi:hypothetical protein
MLSDLKFSEVIEQLRDGKGYAFWSKGTRGYFYKAPYPALEWHTVRDGALSAITYWINGQNASPTLMLYDFDDADWRMVECDDPHRFEGRRP